MIFDALSDKKAKKLICDMILILNRVNLLFFIHFNYKIVIKMK